MKRNLAILLLVAAAIAAVIWMKQDDSHEASPAASRAMEQPATAAPKAGSAAPPFKLSSLDGQQQYEVGGKRDKVLVINFWASWCGPCELEAPDLKTLHAKYKDTMDLYAINATNYDRLRGAKDFVKEQQIRFPVLTDAKGEAGDLYKVHYYPTSFIVDRNGVIRQRIEGVIPLSKWEQYLDEATQS